MGRDAQHGCWKMAARLHSHELSCHCLLAQKALPPCAQAFLRRLDRAGQWRDVVFLDMDALVVAPLAPAFAAAGDAEGPAFDLALTLSDAVDMCAPIVSVFRYASILAAMWELGDCRVQHQSISLGIRPEFSLPYCSSCI